VTVRPADRQQSEASRDFAPRDNTPGAEVTDHAALRGGRRMAKRPWLVLLLGLSLVLGIAWPLSPASAGGDEGGVNREYPLKALFLYNFGGYIEWPADSFASPEAPFVIGVLGSAPIEATLREISAAKKIAGRTIVVKHFATAKEVRGCHILFITRGVSHAEQQQALRTLADKPVLVVGESPNFAQQGGGINFFVEANKLRFEINLATTKQQQLRVSAKLLSLAKVLQ
jgi:hypothetical protein